MSALEDLDAEVEPAFWHCPEYAQTLGPEVRDLMGLFGRTPNPEQQRILDGDFGLDSRGRLVVFQMMVVASRQNLKTGLLEFRALGKALLLRRPLQLWTAHKESATDQAHKELAEMAKDSDELGRRVKKIHWGKGDKAIEFVNGAVIAFRPRTVKGGQSMSADDVDLDEYPFVEASHLGSFVPTMATRPSAKLGGVGSAPHARSDEQRALMARGRAAAEGRAHEPRLLYAEFSVQRQVGTTLDGVPVYGPPPCRDEHCTHLNGSRGCIADDRELIKLANPSVGRSSAPSISWEFIEDERRGLGNSPEGVLEYLRERLGSGVESSAASTTTIFGPAGVWQAGAVAKVADGISAVGIALSPDRSSIGLTGASLVLVEDPKDPEAEPTEKMLVAPILRTGDIDAAIAATKVLQDATDCLVAIDEAGPAASLLERFEDADVAIETLSLQQYARACGRFHDRVTATAFGVAPTPTLLHATNADLDAHVAQASWRWVGDHRIIARRDGQEAVDITLLEAAVLATAEAERAGAVHELIDPPDPGGTP